MLHKVALAIASDFKNRTLVVNKLNIKTLNPFFHYLYNLKFNLHFKLFTFNCVSISLRDLDSIKLNGLS